jgi:hypothetical protein
VQAKNVNHIKGKINFLIRLSDLSALFNH